MFSAHRASVLFAAVAVCSAISQRALAFAIGEEDSVSDKHLAHQWITQQGWRLFQYQFGSSEIDSYLGNVAEYVTGPKAFVIEGVYDEDTKNNNPFNNGGGLDHPSLRHFWDHNSNFIRVFDDGLGAYDSAANRAVKYFTGGEGVTGVVDSDWGTGPFATAGRGIEQEYALGNKSLSYYWLGHAAHLLQDLSVPAHSHNDAHLEGFTVIGNDPDPLHDWADGRAFAVSGSGDDVRGPADFNDVDSHRYERWAFNATQKGVGRIGSSEPFVKADIVSPGQIHDRYNNNGYNLEINQSVPSGYTDAILPLYLLELEAAQVSSRYDSKDVDGQLDQGTRRADRPRNPLDDISLNPKYNNWTQAELDEVADVVVPAAMYDTAALIRFFYSRIDSTPPVTSIQNLSAQQNNPTRIQLTVNEPQRAINVNAQASDFSGVDLDGFKYSWEKFDGANWISSAAAQSGTASFNLGNFGPGLYRTRFNVENGAGLLGTSSYAYFQIDADNCPPNGSIFIGQTQDTLPAGAHRIVDPAGDQPLIDYAAANGHRDYVQTFRLASGQTVDKIIIEIAAAVAGRKIELRLFSVDDPNSDTLVLGQAICCMDYTIDGSDALISQPDTEVLLQWDLNPDVFLAASGSGGYALQVVDTGITGTNSDLYWAAFNNNPYTDGRLYRMENGVLSSIFGTVNGTADATLVLISAVPEPALAGILLAGCVLGIRRRRHTITGCS